MVKGNRSKVAKGIAKTCRLHRGAVATTLLVGLGVINIAPYPCSELSKKNPFSYRINNNGMLESLMLPTHMKIMKNKKG